MTLALWIIVLVFKSPFLKENLSRQSTVCPADFYIKEGKCTLCSDGFFGPDCSSSCPFPSYGRRCLDGDCNCTKDFCDPRKGCMNERINTKAEEYTTQEIATLQNANGTTVVNKLEKNTQRNIIIKESNKNDTLSTVLIAVAVIGTFIIIALVTVLVIQLKGKISIKKQMLFPIRRSQVTSQRHVDTYCEIDDDNLEETENKMWGESEVYESIDQSNKDGSKYTKLPTRQTDSAQKNQISTISMNVMLADDIEPDESIESEVNVQMRQDTNQDLHKRIGKTSANISGYIDMTKSKPADYVSMTAEKLDENLDAQN